MLSMNLPIVIMVLIAIVIVVYMLTKNVAQTESPVSFKEYFIYIPKADVEIDSIAKNEIYVIETKFKYKANVSVFEKSYYATAVLLSYPGTVSTGTGYSLNDFILYRLSNAHDAKALFTLGQLTNNSGVKYKIQVDSVYITFSTDNITKTETDKYTKLTVKLD